MVCHILGHKSYLNKFKRTEIKQDLISEYNGIKLEIINRKIAGKSPKYLDIKLYTSK